MGSTSPLCTFPKHTSNPSQADLQHCVWADPRFPDGPGPRTLSCYLRFQVFSPHILLSMLVQVCSPHNLQHIYTTCTSCLLPCCCSLQRVVAGDWLRRATRSQEHPVCQSHPCQAHCGPLLPHLHHLHLHFSLAHNLIRRHRAGKITQQLILNLKSGNESSANTFREKNVYLGVLQTDLDPGL